jgi:hypothetical protein
MNKQILELKLENLRQKWVNKIPSKNDRNWWAFKCDWCLALRYKHQLETFGNDTVQNLINETVSYEQAKEIFA